MALSNKSSAKKREEVVIPMAEDHFSRQGLHERAQQTYFDLFKPRAGRNFSFDSQNRTNPRDYPLIQILEGRTPGVDQNKSPLLPYGSLPTSELQLDEIQRALINYQVLNAHDPSNRRDRRGFRIKERQKRMGAEMAEDGT